MINVHLHVGDVAQIVMAMIDRRAILNVLQELKQMSGTMSEQMAAAQAETNAKIDAIGTTVTEISADVDRLLVGVQPGDVVTQEMLDAQTAIVARLSGVATSLDEVNTKGGA